LIIEHNGDVSPENYKYAIFLFSKPSGPPLGPHSPSCWIETKSFSPLG
jgi:hypothetical protein